MEDDLKTYIEKLDIRIREMFNSESSGHDIYHLHRVFNLALHLQEKEGGNRLIIGVSALLHDLHRLMEKESGVFCPPTNSLPAVKKLLKEIDFPNVIISRVLHSIEHHEEYSFSKDGKTVNDLETLILQDADNLDAIGAIGVGRTFAFGGAHGVPMWIPEKPFDRDHFDESEKDPSTIHHFYSKLLKLEKNMNTETAKNMAKGRTDFMNKFIEQFISEWKGEK
ncbi:MAG: HD domain-containing protein [Candidatus Paceibacterota bacterium]